MDNVFEFEVISQSGVLVLKEKYGDVERITIVKKGTTEILLILERKAK